MYGYVSPAVPVEELSLLGVARAIRDFLQKYRSPPTMLRLPSPPPVEMEYSGLLIDPTFGPAAVHCPDLWLWDDQVVPGDFTSGEREPSDQTVEGFGATG